MAGTSCCVVLLVAHLAGNAEGLDARGNGVEHQIETFASFDGHVIIQTIFLTGEYQGKSLDNTGEAYVGPWLAALERIRPQEATIYTVARETPIAGLAKAAPEALDAIAARVRALGIPCQVSY